MRDDAGRAESLASSGRVKLHVFEPSRREVWTVVGRSGEHWISPDCSYCSCAGFYFGSLHSDDAFACYHLESARLARREGKVETVIFSDEEFPDFLLGLISDL